MSLKAKAKRLLPFAALFPALLVTAWLWANLPEEHYVSVYSGSGIWDLRGFDFANATASLHGPVEYIAASFLMPKEFAAREGEISRRYPGIRSETATVRVRFIVPSDGYYIITRISTGFADRIYLNGEWLRNIGSPEYGAGDVLLSDIFHFKARPENGVIELQSQQSNFIYHVRAYRDGLLEELVYGNAYQRVAYTTNIVLGIFLAMAVVSLLLFLFSQNYSRPALLFALMCIAWLLFTGAMGSRPFVTIAPWYVDSLRIRLTFIATPVTGILTAAIICELFPGFLHRYFVRTVMPMFAVWVAHFLVSDIEIIMGYTLWICMGITGALTMYPITLFVLNARKLNQPQIIFAIGEVILFYTGIQNILAHLGLSIGGVNLLLPPFDAHQLLRVGVIGSLLCQFAAVFVATTREMEKTKDAEQRLAAENAALDNLSRIKSAFISDISHEIKSPLGIMSGYAQLAELHINQGTANEETTKNLRVVSEEAHRLAQLVERLLNVSIAKNEAASPMPVSVGDIISRAVALLDPVCAANRNRLDVRVEANCPPVAANTAMLLQVLFNLGGNANRHSKDSVIELRVAVGDDSGFVTFTVADKGLGIPPHLLDKVFERGVSGDNSSGLGLPICKEAVESYGGSISVESKHGKGTTVSFTLPVYIEQEAGV